YLRCDGDLEIDAHHTIEDCMLTLGAAIKKALGDGHAFGVSITYSDESPAMLGPGGGIVKALPILGGDHFIVMGSDLWSDFPIATLLDKTHRLAHMVMVNNPDFHSHGDYGITNGFLSKDTPTRTYAGYSVWHPSLFHDAIVGDAIELVPFIEKALALNEITAEKHEGTWHNIGTPGQLQALQRVAL
ncbi:MAG: hypothetical protein COB66_05780, partial [Coxiella sp. (in: Bacteria)]